MFKETILLNMCMVIAQDRRLVSRSVMVSGEVCLPIFHK